MFPKPFYNFLVDSEAITVNYPNIQNLLKDLRLVGGSNALSIRSGAFPTCVLSQLERIYKQDYGTQDGYLPLTFCIIYFMAWTN